MTLADHVVEIVAQAKALDQAITAAADAVLGGGYPMPEGATPEELDAAQLWVIDHLEVLRHNTLRVSLPAAARGLAWLSQAVGESARVAVPAQYQSLITEVMREAQQ